MPTGSSFPAAKNLSKLEGDQVGHIVILSLIRVVLCSTALWIRIIAGHRVPRCRKSRKRKSPHKCHLHWREQPAWALMEYQYQVGADVFYKPYYNKVGTRMIAGRPDGRKAKRKPANHVGCTQWAGSLSFYWLLISAITVSGYTP